MTTKEIKKVEDGLCILNTKTKCTISTWKECIIYLSTLGGGQKRQSMRTNITHRMKHRLQCLFWLYDGVFYNTVQVQNLKTFNVFSSMSVVSTCTGFEHWFCFVSTFATKRFQILMSSLTLHLFFFSSTYSSFSEMPHFEFNIKQFKMVFKRSEISDNMIWFWF